jgi:hypothetical protein
MEISGIILWAIISLLIMIQYAPACKDLSNNDKLIVGIIFMIGGPFFAIVNILEVFLDCFLPEGWDDDGPR